jgi:transcriptional regulator of heat shock response
MPSIHPDDKLSQLLNVVIEHYLTKWDPIGSKFLHNLADVIYAPSTLRKYLNHLEKSWLVYQPYNSSWRIPTVEWITRYIEQLIQNSDADFDSLEFDRSFARNSLRYVVEMLGGRVDGVVTWFIQNDEYYFLGINNLLKDLNPQEYHVVRNIISFIEEKKIVEFLNAKIIKKHHLYYTFIDFWTDYTQALQQKSSDAVVSSSQEEERSDVHESLKVMSCIYTKVSLQGYDAILSIIGPLRVNYKKNVAILKQFLQVLERW